MRLFPSAARRRAGAVVVVCSLALGALAVPLAHADWSQDDLDHQQKRVQKRLEHASHELEMSSGRLIRAARRLDTVRADLSGARASLDTARTKLADASVVDLEMQDRLVQAEADLAFAGRAVTAGTAAVGRQRDSVADVISDIYQEGDPGLVAFASLLDAETPADLMRSAEGRDILVAGETQAYDDLSAAEVLLEVQEGQVEDARREVAAKARDAAAHLVTMADLETEAQTAKNEVVRLVNNRKEASAEAKAAKAADRKELAKLKKEDQRIEKLLVERARRARLRALREARRRATREARLRALSQIRSGAPGDSGGFLAPPVPGVITSSFGMRTHPIFGYYSLHDGTDFGGACGSPMYAAADGRVVSSYSSTSYGNRLLIDHGFQRGVGLATIYNHAVSYTVGVGAQVTRGQLIGYVGSTGWSTGCHLHFTVMANGKPVDSANWL